ncbi:hypothetical protein L1987_80671 [Smallanthus sonchifolius]|uniref:Uncharacterized protein n=1 Tax=Smallanthus sonchifolius TaxID=185202 RepID=A0ACB8YPE7_9ASTR|nr:hypothetical protein L1987_80671 [Smallanthus sonchifolius]
MKKRVKLLKGLSKNLSTLSEMGFCLHPDSGLDQQVKGQIFTEATEILIGQLQKLKEDKSESKRMKKAKKTKDSSSESCSSESDCDNVVSQQSSVQVIATGKVEEDCGKKIEVCMGGKCKKSGGAMLLENFQKAVGGEAEVVGCKCMGNCRDGPNVKVRSSEEAMATSLCIGVGLEDVETIVANFFGGRQRSCSHMLPAMSIV